MFRDANYATISDHGYTPVVPTLNAGLCDVFHRINFCSDLHLDFEGIDDRFFIENPAQTLVIAGDIGEVRSYQTTRFQDFFRRASEHWNDVLIIAGNHEHYNARFDETIDRMREAVKEFVNITVLDKSSIEIDGVLFVGGTMWTNFGNENQDAMAVARIRMNDYQCIQSSTKPITPFRTLADHKETIAKFEEILNRNSNKAVVVITHHAPSMKSVDPDYIHEELLNFAYASNLEEFIKSHPNIIHWIHGHMHSRKMYHVGETQIHLKARGYPNQFNDYRTYTPAEIFV